ncbi:MAG: hypothetical protein N838_23060 [Thiohalocapsa sp. PB-PSB1]|jgi:hypothetical protein|nr:MAG: hypothetical protein N838_23060 [Thiohalocapsa sp. PB-PSB1]
MADPKPMDTNTLYKIFTFIRSQWGTSDGVSEDQFELIVGYKANSDPAYAFYYTVAVATYEALLKKLGNEEAALTALYQENQQPDPANQDIAQYVLGEFLTMNIAFGGFSLFGYENFRGWMGGGSFEDTPPPYRTATGETE